MAKFDDILDSNENLLNTVKKDFAKSFEIKDSHLGKWLSWHEATQGKWFRAKLALSTGEQLGLSKQTSIIWATVCELIHSASLLHDDICDKDILRRGKAAVWKEFGIPAAICTGDFLIAEAFRKITEIEQGWQQTILLKLLSCTVKEIIFGQSQDVAYGSLNTSPTFNLGHDEWQMYTTIAKQKTAPLISLPMLGMLKCAEAESRLCDNLNTISEHLGLAYQLLNDLENILEKPQLEKPQLEKPHINKQINLLPSDIDHGRANAVVILYMRNASTLEKNLLINKDVNLIHLFHSKNIISQSCELVAEQILMANDLNQQLSVAIRPILLSASKQLDKRLIKLRDDNLCLSS